MFITGRRSYAPGGRRDKQIIARAQGVHPRPGYRSESYAF
jgi:hypothetical protein